jgi:hypothetical protein
VRISPKEKKKVSRHPEAISREITTRSQKVLAQSVQPCPLVPLKVGPAREGGLGQTTVAKGIIVTVTAEPGCRALWGRNRSSSRPSRTGGVDYACVFPI